MHIFKLVYEIIFVQDYGHRVRLATHSNFKEFVLTAGLEFYPLGGDPKVLAGCMYRNALCVDSFGDFEQSMFSLLVCIDVY